MTLKMSRLVDPVHFFTAEGVSVLSLKHLLERNKVLEEQVERLTRMLGAQVARNKLNDSESDNSTKQ